MADDDKKLSYEEAAEQLGLTVDQLRDLRADGRIRDHADYGNWTFKAEDVQALKAELEAEAAAPPPAAARGRAAGGSGRSLAPGGGARSSR